MKREDTSVSTICDTSVSKLRFPETILKEGQTCNLLCNASRQAAKAKFPEQTDNPDQPKQALSSGKESTLTEKMKNIT